MHLISIVPISVFVALLCGCLHLDHVGSRRVPETQGFQPDSAFQFTISPDDRWIVFFKQLTPDQVGTRDNQYGNLCVLDRQRQVVQTIIVDKAIAPRHLTNADTAWAPDSSFCVLPPPNPDLGTDKRGMMIRMQDPNGITVERVVVQNGRSLGVQVPSEGLLASLAFTCSDCTPHLNDIARIRQHIPPKYIKEGDLEWDRNQYAAQVMSPDGSKILFQKGRRTQEVSLFCHDMTTKQERELTSHTGDCAKIMYMRPSPDGRSLAYQVVTGCDFVSDGAVWVIDIATGNREQVGVSSGGTMHWTSTSEQLYFYRDNALWVAEFEKPPALQPATSQPASTQPASR